jgi:hypothetical protein
MGKLARHEWRRPAVFAALVMAVTMLPYLVAVARQSDEWRFGGFLFGVEDGNSYIAKMGEGARGAWLFTLPYSSEPQRGVPFFEFYLGLGKLAGPDHDAEVVVYHVARLVCGWALLMVSYLFLAEFLPRVKQRRLGLALTAVGGGLGWLLMLSGQSNLFGTLPIDFMSPEAYSFLNLYGLPHLAAARCLLLLGLLAYLRGHEVWAGLALLAMSLIQPLSVVTAGVVLVFDFVFGVLVAGVAQTLSSPKPALRQFRALALTGLISSPFVIYTTAAFSLDPVLRQWNAQNLLPSPNPLHYLLGYGVYVVLGVYGWRALASRSGALAPRGQANRRRRLARFMGAWVVAAPLMIYIPISTQRRLIEGFQLPLVILAVWGLTVTLRRWRRWLLPVVFGLTLPSSAVLLAVGLVGAYQPGEPVYHPSSELQVFDWLRHNAVPGQVVLSSFETGNVVPAYTPLVAYIGHGPETVFLADKRPRVEVFYQAAGSEADRRQLLADGRIGWVIFGPQERALGNFDPARAGYLHPAYSNGAYAVYAADGQP